MGWLKTIPTLIIDYFVARFVIVANKLSIEALLPDIGPNPLPLVAIAIFCKPVLSLFIAFWRCSAFTLAVLTLGIIALKKAKDAYTKSTLAATVATKGFAVALMANPAMLVVSAISLLVGALTTLGTALDENVEKQSRLNEAKERYKEIVNGQAEYTNDYANEIKQNTENLKKQIDLYLQLDKLYKERGKRKGSLYILYDDNGNIIDKMPDLDQKIKNTEKELKNLQDSTVDYGNDIGALFNAYQEGKKYLEEYEKVQKESTVLDNDVIRNKKKEE